MTREGGILLRKGGSDVGSPQGDSPFIGFSTDR